MKQLLAPKLDEEGEEAMQTQYQNPAIKQAFRKLTQLSTDEETRNLAELYLDIFHDIISDLSRPA